LKPVNQKKVLGIALGERSLLAAEVVAGADRPKVAKLAEMPFPPGVSLFQPAELARALAHFLKDNHFASRSAVVGIPLKWLVVKQKEVPPADDATVSQLLRLEAESEFSTELKDLVYDFAGAMAPGAVSRSVLLAATPKKYIDAIESLCDAARIGLLAVTPSALALGSLTGSSQREDILVLSVGTTGSELSSQRQSSATAMAALRSSASQPPFISELRRAVSTLPISQEKRDMVLWNDAGLDATRLGQQLGLTVRAGELGSFGVDAGDAGVNGQGAKYAAAVALALSAMSESGPAIDFLHSRLAPPRQRRIPRWAYVAAGVLALLVVLIVWGYHDLSLQQQVVSEKNALIASQQSQADAARDFVNKETLAEYWRGGDPRYMECMRDLYSVIPEDGQTYATSLEIKAPPPPLSQDKSAGTAPSPSTEQQRLLSVTLQGHTSNVETVTSMDDRMNQNAAIFKNVKIGPETKVPRTQEYLFSITFDYVPPHAAAATQPSAK